MTTDFFTKLSEAANVYLKNLPGRPVGAAVGHEKLLAGIKKELPETGETPEIAIQTLISGVEQGLVHSTSPRYFGFVTGGATPVSVAADWLTSVWNQNAQVYLTSPAAAIVEDIVAQWILGLLGLPPESGVGLVTGTQMAHFTALSIARNSVLQRQGWNPDKKGLQGAPPIHVICGECCHVTVRSTVRLIGLGTDNIHLVSADEEGRIRLTEFKKILETCPGPCIVCLQAGNVNTGAFDPLADIIALCKNRGAWVHVDGAFGLWAAASPKFAHLVKNVEGADSWATDAHKWLNVPYDSGIVIVRDRQAHRNFKTDRCAYAGTADSGRRDGSQWAPENSRRARGFVLYAALRNLGKQGVRELVENCCGMARLFADELAKIPNVRVLNDVVLNQVLFRLEPQGVEDLDAFNSTVAALIQQEGVCWMGTTQWRGRTALRISVSNWSTTRSDVHKSVAGLTQAMQKQAKGNNGLHQTL